MKALHFCAASIGRGFIGKLLANPQAELTFADINLAVLDQLNSRKNYQVRIVGKQTQFEKVNKVSGVNRNSEEAVALIAEAYIVSTAICPQILSKIAATLAKGDDKTSPTRQRTATEHHCLRKDGTRHQPSEAVRIRCLAAGQTGVGRAARRLR